MSQKFLRLPLRRARGNQPTYQGVWAKHFTPPLGRPLVTGITGDREMGLLRGVSTSAPGLAHALPGPRECNETRPQTRLCGRAAAGIRSRRNLARMLPQQEPPAGLRRTPSGVALRAGLRPLKKCHTVSPRREVCHHKHNRFHAWVCYKSGDAPGGAPPKMFGGL